MKDELLKKLDRVSDLDDRRLLKNILINVFDPIVEHNMSMYETLRKNIYDEIEDSFEKYYIHTTVDSIENIDPISSFYHLMHEDDNTANEIDFKMLTESLNNSEKVKFATVFMEMDSCELNKLVLQKRYYKCTITTEKDVINTKVYLEKSDKYSKKIEELYKVFQFNDKDWKTINAGYSNKFVDVFFGEILNIDKGDSIKEISIDLGEYEKYKRPNYVMLWNIKFLEVEDKSFPKPLEDTMHYEHSIHIEKDDRNCGFLINTNHNYIKYIKQTQDSLIIANDTDIQDVWSIIRIENISKNILKQNVEYKELSNKRNLGFVGRFANEKALIIRTRGEIARIFESYDLSKELKFKDVSIVEKYEKEINTIDFNYFLDNNLRNDSKRSYMVLKFESTNRDDFLLYDKVSFFVSIAGLMFPEYNCVGEIV